MKTATQRIAWALAAAMLLGTAGCPLVIDGVGGWNYGWDGAGGGLITMGEVQLRRPVVRGLHVTIGGTAGIPVRSIRWVWGDGRSDTTAGFPAGHTYAVPGRYRIQAFVYARDGRTLTASTRVRVWGSTPPGGRLTLYAPTVFGRRVTLGGACSVPYRSIRWNWGDGTSTRTRGFPGSHTYAAGGTYTVTVRVFPRAGAVLQATTTVTVGSAPQGEQLALDPPAITGRSVTLNGRVLNGRVHSVRWNWGDGHRERRTSFPGRHTYQRAGAYNIECEVHTRSGKALFATLSVVIGGPPPSAARLSLAAPVVAGRAVTVNGAVVNGRVRSVRWNWGDGRNTITPSFPGRHTYARGGTYTIGVTVRLRSGRTLHGTTRVRVGGPPPPAGPRLTLGRPVVAGRAVTVNGAVVNGRVRSVRWNWGDGRNTVTPSFPGRHTYARGGTYTIGVTVRLRSGRTLHGTTRVRVGGGPHGPLELHAPMVVGRRVTLGGAFRLRIPIKEIQWHWGDGKTSKTRSFPGRHLYSRAGTYSITVAVHTLGRRVFRATTRVRVR